MITMNKRTAIGIFILPVFVVLGFTTITHAQTTELTPEKQTIIEQSCVSAQTVLQRIQHNDAATRVNRGQGYETLVSRLMTPLNSRATSRGYNDSASLMVDTTKRYQQGLESFKDHYKAYDDAISGSLRVKCKQEPAKFYGYIEEARRQRQNLASDVGNLSGLINEYRGNVIKLRSEVQ